MKRLALLIGIGAVLLAGCGGGDSDTTSTAAALSSCDINGKQRDFNASYVTSIEVAGATCPQAEEIVAMYHRCRLQNGGAGGTCDTPLRGFKCTEGARQSVPGVQYNATVDCTKGDLEIKSTYTQNF